MPQKLRKLNPAEVARVEALAIWSEPRPTWFMGIYLGVRISIRYYSPYRSGAIRLEEDLWQPQLAGYTPAELKYLAIELVQKFLEDR